MADFGGLGGIFGTRCRNPEDLFEAAVERVFGDRLRLEGRNQDGWSAKPGATLGQRLWGSLANVDWRHDNGDTASYSFRAAGDLIAAVIGSGDYLDWYCSDRSDGVPYDDIVDVLAREGWHPIEENADE